MPERAEDFVAAQVAAFNHPVAAADFGDFLRRFSDDAVIRFENLPGGLDLEFAGRAAYTQAYAEQPPDDQMDVDGPVTEDGPHLAVPFAWRRDKARGTMRLTCTDDLITAMTVVFE